MRAIRLPRSLHDLGIVATADGVGKLVGLVTIGVTARLLGPAGLGLLAAIQALLSYFGIISSLGLSQWGLRRGIAERRFERGFVARIVALQGVTVVVLFPAVLVLTRGLFGPVTILAILTGTATILLNNLRAEWVAQGAGRFGVLAVAKLAYEAVTLVGTVVFLPAHPTVTTVFVIQDAALAAACLAFWPPVLQGLAAPGTSKQVLRWSEDRAAFLLALATIGQTIYFNIDRVMLGVYGSRAALGQYDGAYRLISGIAGLAVVASAVTAPLIFRMLTEKSSSLERVVWALSVAGFACTIIVIVFARLGASIVLGRAYTHAPRLAVLLSTSVAVAWFQLVFGPMLQQSRRERTLVAVATMGGLLNFMLNLFLIPAHGTVGAAYATIASEVVVGTLLLWHIRQHLGEVGRQSIAIVLVASPVMSIVAADHGIAAAIPVALVALGLLGWGGARLMSELRVAGA